MTELRVQDLRKDELLREVESAATEAVRRERQDLRETVDRLQQSRLSPEDVAGFRGGRAIRKHLPTDASGLEKRRPADGRERRTKVR